MYGTVTNITFNNCLGSALVSVDLNYDDRPGHITFNAIEISYNNNNFCLDFPQWYVVGFCDENQKAYTLSHEFRSIIRKAIAEYLLEHPHLYEALQGKGRFISQPKENT